MAHQTDVVVVGASAGGVEALVSLVPQLPLLRVTSIVIVLHVAPLGKSILAQILGRHTQLQVTTPVDGETLAPGVIYVAPPDHHVLVRPGALALSRGGRINGHRPAIDAAMQTAASTYGCRSAGLILSGMLKDGAAGLAAIHAAGGQVAVEDPAEALHAGMPSAALRSVPGALVLAMSQVAAWIAAADAGFPDGG